MILLKKTDFFQNASKTIVELEDIKSRDRHRKKAIGTIIKKYKNNIQIKKTYKKRKY